jgi:aryl-alcohol dehydrogenase-like predicted oxidoreductase
MDEVRLGATGLQVSRVCLGMMSYGNDSDRAWVLDEANAEPIIRRAVDGGITFFDTADVYSQGPARSPPDAPCRSTSRAKGRSSPPRSTAR